jgi:hypothetical protein
VELQHIEGEWWAVIGPDNEIYEAAGLPDDFHHSGLRVYLQARELVGFRSGHAIQSRIVEIVSIRRLG